MRLLLTVLLVLVAAAPVGAQTTLTVDIDKAAFAWDWAQGDGGAVEEFRIYCGTLVHVIADPAARSIGVREVVKSPGTYICTIRAANAFGESEDSPAITFHAGSAPAAATSLRIEAR